MFVVPLLRIQILYGNVMLFSQIPVYSFKALRLKQKFINAHRNLGNIYLYSAPFTSTTAAIIIVTGNRVGGGEGPIIRRMLANHGGSQSGLYTASQFSWKFLTETEKYLPLFHGMLAKLALVDFPTLPCHLNLLYWSRLSYALSFFLGQRSLLQR